MWVRRATSRGVTMLELILVVGLVSILAGLAAPELRRSVRNARERQEIRDVRDWISEAGSSARSMRTSVTVTLDDNQVRVSSSLTGTTTHALSSNITGVWVSTGSRVLTFNAQGGLSGITPVAIVLSTSRGVSYTYTVYPAIGAIRLE